MKDIDGVAEVLKTLEPYWSAIEADFKKHNERFKELNAAGPEVIGRILRAHLVVETFMDAFLEEHFGIEDFDALRLSFFQKAKLLPTKAISAAFVRPGILQLNAVRNKFGHSLGHKIERHEIVNVYEVLRVARKDALEAEPCDAIEAFAPIACAFLSVPPKDLQEVFTKAFAEVQSFSPENGGS